MISIAEKKIAEMTAAFSFLKNSRTSKYMGKIDNELNNGGNSKEYGKRGNSVNV